MSFKNSVILSGGFGSRMRPITDYIPKALVEVDGLPLIGHVFNMIGSDTNRYITYGHKSEVLFNSTKLVADGYINPTRTDNSFFLYNSFVKHINEPIIVSPCDMIMDIDLDKVYEDYIELGSPSIMVVGVEPVDGVAGDYIEYDESNTIVRLDRDNVTDKYCSGLQIINPFKVNDTTAECDNFYDVWKQLKYMGELKVSNVLPTKWRCYDDIKSVI